MKPGPPLLTSAQIQKRVRMLAKEISTHYQGKPLVVLGLLNGALFFMVDLARGMSIPFQLESWRLRSYDADQSTGRIEGLNSGLGDFKGRHVLVVDDVLDTGLTLSKVEARLNELGAKSVRICVLLRKKTKRVRPVRPRWVGFDIGSEFVVGYGLDYNGAFRSLPQISIIQPEKRVAVSSKRFVSKK